MIKRLLSRAPGLQFVIVLSIALLPWSAANAAGDVSARVVQPPTGQGGSIQLLLESSGEVGGYPDLSPLSKDFVIVGRSQQSSVTVINGRSFRRTRWRLTLMPLRSGELEIPPIAIGGQRTQALKVQATSANPTTAAAPYGHPATTHYPYPSASAPSSPAATRPVQKAAPGDDLRIEAVFYPEEAFTGQQLMLQVRVLSPSQWPRGRFSLPTTQPAGIPVQPMGQHYYLTEVNGRQMAVLEQDFALFPSAEGRLEAGPIVFTPAPVYTLDGSVKSGAPIESRRIAIEIRPLPAAPPAFDPRTAVNSLYSLVARGAPFPLPFVFSGNNPRTTPPVTVPAVTASEESPMPSRRQGQEGKLPWITLALAVGWALTLLTWWWHRRGYPLPLRPRLPRVLLPKVPARLSRLDARRRVIRRVERAWEEQNALEAKAALLAWGRAVWQEHPPANLGRLAERCRGELAEAIRRLDEALYGRRVTPEVFAAPIGRLLRRFDAQASLEEHLPPEGLAPLNPAYSKSP